MNEKFWLGVWCDVNTTVSTLSLSRRRHSACRGLSLFLPRSSSRSLAPRARRLRRPRGRHASLSLAPGLPTLFRVGHAVQQHGGYPVDSTQLHPHTPAAWPAAASGETHAHARTHVRAYVWARARAGAFALANFRTPKISTAGSPFRPPVGTSTEYEQ